MPVTGSMNMAGDAKWGGKKHPELQSFSLVLKEEGSRCIRKMGRPFQVRADGQVRGKGTWLEWSGSLPGRGEA